MAANRPKLPTFDCDLDDELSGRWYHPGVQEASVHLYKYAKVLLLAPAIGSALIGIAGLLLGMALIKGRGHTVDRLHADANSKKTLVATEQKNSVAAFNSASMRGSSLPVQETAAANGAQILIAGSHARSQSVSWQPKLAQHRGSEAHLYSALFKEPIASDQLEFLSQYEGRPANDVVHEQRLRDLVNKVAPYAPFHAGLDMPLPTVVESMFSTSTQPVEIREGRYAMVFGRRTPNARGRGFIWIDMKEGIALGGIFIYPSNGEPTPTLTIFSRQVSKESVAMSQFPSAFVQDLTRWASLEGVPPVTTRYFINASSKKVVLTHDEDFCSRAQAAGDSAETDCNEMNAKAANIDLQAANFLEQTHYASNATIRMISATN
jgi:hypothetical protein